jgi:hypothetical protein
MTGLPVIAYRAVFPLTRLPDLREAMEKAKADGLAYVIPSADRCDEKTMSVKGKHTSGLRVEPGSIHDLTVAPHRRQSSKIGDIAESQ